MLREETEGMFVVYTSEDVLDEAHRVWRRRKPELGGTMRSDRDQRFRECFDDICTDWVGGKAPGTDIDDAHVHNAAVHMQVDILLTGNVNDFGDPLKLPYDLYTPDEFFGLIHENAPSAVRKVAVKQAEYWQRQSGAGSETRKLSAALAQAACPEFGLLVEKSLQYMSGVLSSVKHEAPTPV